MDDVPPSPEHPDDLCACGHTRSGHIYNEGACRVGGVICPCTDFRAANPKQFVAMRKINAPQPPSFSTEQMEALLDEKSPGWRDNLPRLEWVPEDDPYWKRRAFELGQEVLDSRLEIARLRRMVIGCDCGMIHDAYNELRDQMTLAQIEFRKQTP